jgi:hypothetical protein
MEDMKGLPELGIGNRRNYTGGSTSIQQRLRTNFRDGDDDPEIVVPRDAGRLSLDLLDLGWAGR